MAKLKWGTLGAKWGQPGLLWNGDAPNTNHQMNTVVLSLDALTEAETIAEARRNTQGLTDHAAAFTGAAPTAAQLTTASEAATLDKDNTLNALRLAYR